MKNRIIISALFIFITLGGLQAQEAITAAGGDLSGSGGSAAYAVGQVAYTTITGTNGSVSGGIIQAYEIFISSDIEIKGITLRTNVFPNPTSNFLTLEIDNPNNLELAYQLYNVQGILLSNMAILSNSTSIKMEKLPNATYLLKITLNNQLVKT